MSTQPNTVAAAQHDAEQLFAVDKLRLCAEHIRDAIKTMVFYHSVVMEYVQTDVERARIAYQVLEGERKLLLERLAECRLPLQEIEEDSKAAYAEILKANAETFNLLTPDYSAFEKILKEFAGSLPTANETVNAGVIGRLMNNVRLGYYPTDLDNIRHIRRGVHFPTGVHANLLDPCCGTGEAVQEFAACGDALTFGVELDGNRAAEAQKTLSRVGFGSFFGSQISHGAFHALWLNPPYLSVIEKGGGRSRDEKKFLIESMPYLMPEGLLVYIIPHYRLTTDICTILTDNFSDLSLWRFTDSEYKKFRQLAVMGVKKKRKESDEAATHNFEVRTYDVSALPCVSEISEGRYVLPAVPKTVDLFKGAEFNELELAEQLAKSDSFEHLFSRSSLDRAGRRPPLPLNIGQIGLIGGSGLVNGLIECAHPHVLKGRVIKVRRVNVEPIYGDSDEAIGAETRETTTNKMIMNVLTPDGFVSLA